ncbi:hypothetical protein [Caulobacter sp. CCG-8]|uniref:hypothetical protein n=1 Tax=Caulobacter sp. CCG-8 TaxID=3127958 RepID=UPI00307EF308
MTTIAQTSAVGGARPDVLSGDRTAFIDRWIYVFTAASFIVIVLLGFIPDSLGKMAAVEAGQRPPFPVVLHVHAALMGSYMLLLLTQTWLVATGQVARHRLLGTLGAVLAAALVVVGFVLIPTIYHQVFAGAQAAPPPAKAQATAFVGIVENIMLLQLRIGFLFSILVFLGVAARVTDPGFHKRMMILSIAVALPAAFDRITWIPTTLPGRPVSSDLYVLLAIAPMFLWDIYRNRRIHRAYWVWLAVAAPFTVAVHALWDTPFWHATAKRLMGV